MWGGLTKTRTVNDLLFGFNTDLNSLINTGDLLRGNLYVDSVVTPVCNWWKGPAADNTYTMINGQSDINQAGQIYSMNDNSIIWLANSLYTVNTTNPTGQWLTVDWYN